MPPLPQIGGSFGGFIAVVVILCVVIVGACIAVFLLLRRNITDADRAARRQRRYQHSALPTSSSSRSEFDYSASSQPPGPTGIRAAIRRLLGYEPAAHTSGGSNARSRSASGWQQADSGDEWDASDLQPSILHRQQDLTDISTQPLSFVPPVRPSRNPGSISSTVPTLPTIQPSVPLPSFTPDAAPKRTGSPEPMTGTPTDTASPVGTSTDSSGRKASFPGGTRFHEEL